MNESRYRASESGLWTALGRTPAERFVRLGPAGPRVRVQELGDGPPVLFIHGANTSGLSWATLAAKLRSFRCLLVDRPGTGLSDALPGRIGTAELIQLGDTFVASLLDALEIERAHVVATSLGGFVALRGAARNPERFDRMVQFSWPAGAPTIRVPASMRLTAVPGVARIAAALPASPSTVRSIFRSVGHGPSLAAGRITADDIAAYLGLLRFTDTLRNDLALSRAAVSPLRGLNRALLPASVLARIHVPTLFIWGERDSFGDVEVARSVAAAIPHAKLEVLPGAGHAPWLDDLDRCARLTSEFLALEPPIPATVDDPPAGDGPQSVGAQSPPEPATGASPW
jgi:pimeloyl-ACP methyl ester carboxylesterase